MTSVVAPYPPLRPRDSCAASSFRRAPAPPCADRVRFDPSRVLMVPEDAAARDGKRRRCHEAVPLPTKRRREGDDGSRASKMQADEHISSASPVAYLSCARIRPAVYASRPKEDTTKLSARAVRNDAHGVTKKQQETSERIPCTGIRPAVQATRPKEETKVSSARALRHDAQGVSKKQEASERVQVSATRSSPQLAQPAPATKPDPSAAHDALRAALAVGRQALDGRQNIYRREREDARRELDKVVQTVEFNDPYIAPEDVLKP